jgi:hypothetical protein
MQTITFNDSNISAYIFEDEHSLIATTENITCPHFIIGDMNTTNATITTGVTAPDDWKGGKYLFDGTNWTENADWTDSRLAEIDRLQDRILELQT